MKSMEQERYLEALSDVLLKLPPKQIEDIFNQRLKVMRECIEAELARRRTDPASPPPAT